MLSMDAPSPVEVDALENAGSNDVDDKASLEGASQASSDDDNINNEAYSRRQQKQSLKSCLREPTRQLLIMVRSTLKLLRRL